MDLFTRCTRCHTVFRVTTGDLQASGGQVRCGRCRAVFDAFASLTARPPGQADEDLAALQDDGAEDESSAHQGVAETSAAELQGPSPIEVAAPKLEFAESDADRSGLEDLPEGESDSQTDSETTPAATTQVREDDASITQAQISGTAPEESNRDDPANGLYEWEYKATPRDSHSRLWLGLSALLGLVAVGQFAYVFRTPLIMNYPQLRPGYELVCSWFSCEIGLPRLAQQLDISASDLQLVNPETPNQVELTATIRNRARTAVEYPAFELTLTNEGESVVARRVFMPDEYLPDLSVLDAGLAGSGELAIRLFLDIGPLGAAGYRIYLFYPP